MFILIVTFQGLKSRLAEVDADRLRVQTDLQTVWHTAQTDAMAHQQTVSGLQQQLQLAEQTVAEYRRTQGDSLKLALDLEREKGRLSGIDSTLIVF